MAVGVRDWLGEMIRILLDVVGAGLERRTTYSQRISPEQAAGQVEDSRNGQYCSKSKKKHSFGNSQSLNYQAGRFSKG